MYDSPILAPHPGENGQDNFHPILAPQTNVPPVLPPASVARGTAQGVIMSVDNATTPKFATVLINNKLPGESGLTVPIGVGPFAAGGTSGYTFFYNNSSGVGGSLCTVDLDRRVIISIDPGVSTTAPTPLYAAITNHKHSGNLNPTDGVPDPAPVNLANSETQNNLPYNQNTLAIQNVINSSGNVLATDFPGQLILQNSGSYQGLYQQSIQKLKDGQGYTLSAGQWLWLSWYSMSTVTTQDWGPMVFDTNSHFYAIDCVNGAGNIYVNNGSTSTGIGGLAANSTNNTSLHSFVMGVNYVGGTTFRIIAIADGAILADVTDTSSPLSPTLYPGFLSGTVGAVYHHDFSFTGGNQITSGNFVQMPAAIKSSGPTISSSSLGGTSTTGGATYDQTYNVTFGDWATTAQPLWFKKWNVYTRLHGSTNASINGDIWKQSSPQVAFTGLTAQGFGAGNYYDIGFSVVDISGVESAIVWPANLQTSAPPASTAITTVALAAGPGTSPVLGTISPSGRVLGKGVSATLTFTITVTDLGSSKPSWIDHIQVVTKPDVETKPSTDVPVDWSTVTWGTNSCTFSRTIRTYSGETVNIGVYYVAANGTTSPVTWGGSGYVDPDGPFFDPNDTSGTAITHSRSSLATQKIINSSGQSLTTDFTNMVEADPTSSTAGLCVTTAQYSWSKSQLSLNVNNGAEVFEWTGYTVGTTDVGLAVNCSGGGTTTGNGTSSGPTSGYLTYINHSGNISIYKWGVPTAGQWNQVASIASTQASGITNGYAHHLKVIVTGSSSAVTIWMKLDNSTPLSWTDTSGTLCQSGTFGLFSGAPNNPAYTHDFVASQSQADATNIIHSGSIDADYAGGSANLIPDSDFKFGIAGSPTSYWGSLAAPWSIANSASGRMLAFTTTNGTVYTTVNYTAMAAMIPVSAGVQYVLSGMISSVNLGASGSVSLIVLNAQTNGELVRIQIANSGLTYASAAPVTIPSGCTKCYLIVQVNGTGNGGQILIGRPQFEQGTVATAYKSSTSDHINGYFLRGAHHPSITNVIDQNSNIPTSTPFNKSQGSIPPIGTPAASASSSYNSTTSTSSITVSVPAATFYLPDGTQISPVAWSSTSTGWSPGAVYYMTIAYSIANGYQVLYGPVTTAPNTQQSAQINGDGYYPITHSLQVTAATATNTTSSGSGGGGGTCPAVDQPILTKEHGLIPAGDIEPGMHLLGPDGEWKRVMTARTCQAAIIKVTAGGESFKVEHHHRWFTVEEEWVETCDLSLGHLLKTVNGDAVQIQGIELIGDGDFRRLHVVGEQFVMGNGLIAHNVITQ